MKNILNKNDEFFQDQLNKRIDGYSYLIAREILFAYFNKSYCLL